MPLSGPAQVLGPKLIKLDLDATNLLDRFSDTVVSLESLDTQFFSFLAAFVENITVLKKDLLPGATSALEEKVTSLLKKPIEHAMTTLQTSTVAAERAKCMTTLVEMQKVLKFLGPSRAGIELLQIVSDMHTTWSDKEYLIVLSSLVR